jgi:hypothetical protein
LSKNILNKLNELDELLFTAGKVVDNGRDDQPGKAFEQEKHKGRDAGPFGPFNGGTLFFREFFFLHIT